MNTITKTIVYLQLTALCFATAFADPNLKEKDFSGPITSVETADIDFTTLIMLVDGNGTGQAGHLGQFTYTYQFVVDLSTGIGVGSAEFTAANGDTFSTEVTGLGVPEAPAPLAIGLWNSTPLSGEPDVSREPAGASLWSGL